jgi:hypothetical protein
MPSSTQQERAADAALDVASQVALEDDMPTSPQQERAPDSHHTVIIANQRTASQRLTDTPANARKYRRRTVAALMAFRALEDQNFANRATLLARRLDSLLRSSPEVYGVTSGAEFLDALKLASLHRPIKKLVVYGHASSTALYMREDLGFYADIGDVATQTAIVHGSNDAKQEALRQMGARDFADLARLINQAKIRFEKGATIVFAGCSVAGRRNADISSIAGRMARMLGATVVASIDVTDQSMVRARNKEYSRRGWVRFVRSESPEKLNTKVIDTIRHLMPEETKGMQTSSAEPVLLEKGMQKIADTERFRHKSTRLEVRRHRNRDRENAFAFAPPKHFKHADLLIRDSSGLN